MYRAWLLRVLEGKVAIQTVCECDRLAAEAMARAIGITPHWRAAPAVAVAQAPVRVKRERRIKGRVLNLGGGHCVAGVRLPL